MDKVAKVKQKSGPKASRFDSEKLYDAVIDAVRNGMTFKDAARSVGYSYDWIRHKRSDDDLFKRRLDEAMEQFKLSHIQNIQKHSNRSWQASAWLLERIFPLQFNARIAERMSEKESKPTEKPSWFGKQLDIEKVEEAQIIENGESEPIEGEAEIS